MILEPESRLYSPLSARRREHSRRLAIRLIYLLYILALCEGPLRKWFLPGLGTPLIFLRDPLVLGLYLFALSRGLFIRITLRRLWIGTAILTSLAGLPQFMFANLPAEGWMLGVRTYWLYVPLPFLIARVFQYEDIHRFLILNLITSLPYSILTAAQYNAGPQAWVNRGVAGDEYAAVGVSLDIVRPFGLFTFASQNADFTAAIVAMFFAFFLWQTPWRYRRLILAASTPAVATMAVLTGSRSIYFISAAIIGLSLAGLLILKPSRRSFSISLGIIIALLIAATLLVRLFPDMFMAMTLRFDQASDSEGSIWRRALITPLAFIEPLMTAPFFGHGIGAGAPGVARFLGLGNLPYGEDDLARNVNELGVILGLIVVALRWGTAVWIIWTSVQIARGGELASLPLAGYVAIPVAFGALTASPLSAFMTWTAFGLFLALVEAARGRCAVSTS